MKKTLAAVILLLLGQTVLEAENWPQWRGPKGTGESSEKSAPLKWSAKENIKWKTPLPDAGNSTPVVWGQRVFITCAADKGAKRSLLCFDRADGKKLWQADVAFSGDERTHDTNPYCSASPVTDGERVVVWHGSAGAYCYDFSGKELWKKDLGAFDQVWGNASSPVLAKDMAIYTCGPSVKSFVVALDKRTGEEKWRISPPTAQSKNGDEYRGCWSTPVVFQDGTATRVLISLPERLVALDPDTGKEVWSSGGLSPLQYASPLIGSDYVVAMSGYHGPAMAVKLGGSGDVTDSHRLWRKTEKIPQRVGSGVLVGDHIYILQDGGQCWCIEARTGETKWEKKLTGSWCSMVSAAGRLYVSDTSGKTYVIAPDPKECRVLAENILGETTRASLAFSDGQAFARTYKHLYCLEEPVQAK